MAGGEKKCAAFKLAGTLIRRAAIEQIRKLGGTSTAFQKCCAAFSGGTKRRKSQRRVELLLSHWCWTLSLWHSSGCATLALLKGTQLNLTGTVGSGMDRTQVWAVWCFCWLLKMKTTTYTQIFILFKCFFYVFIHCPVQSIRIQLFLIFESDPCTESHVLNFNNSPIDKNPDFQFQMVQLVSMKEPPSNLPEDAWGFRLLPRSHSLVCACVQHPLWHCNNCRTPQHEEKHNEMN